MMAPGLVAATEADGRLFVVSTVNPEAHVLDPDATEWRSLGSAGVDGDTGIASTIRRVAFLEPVGVAGGRWLFVGGDRIIHAPQHGERIRFDRVGYQPVKGYGRPRG